MTSDPENSSFVGMHLLPFFTLALRVFIGGYFLIAAVPKIIEPLAFATSISHYGIMPDWSVNATALILPWLELLVGVGLLVGFRIRTSAMLTGLLLIGFTAAIAWAVIQGLQIDCGCFGEGRGEEVSWLKVGKNSLMIVGCIILYLFPRSRLSLDEVVEPHE
jgi:putative oxidoreductase